MSGGLQLSDAPALSPSRRPAQASRSKVSKWDRPPPPKDWRYFVGGLGKILIALGLLTFGFVAYQLWGTGIETAQAQDELADQFDTIVADTPDPADVIDVTAAGTATDGGPQLSVKPSDPEITKVATAEGQSALPTAPDGAIMRMEIPKIDVDYYVVAGVGREDLKRGIGHFPSTPWAGQLGNAAFAGHRTTYGGPLYHADKLEPGDRVNITRVDGNKYSYEVTSSEVVLPDDVAVLGGDPNAATIVLVTCTPVHSASHRLLIHAKLVPSESAVVGVPTFYDQGETPDFGTATTLPPTTTVQPSTTAAPTTVSDDATTETTEAGEFVPRPTTIPPTTVPETTAPTPATTVFDSAGLEEEASGVIDDQTDDSGWDRGWFDDRDAVPLVAMWGAALLAIYVASRLLARWTRHEWIGIVVAVAPFLYCLYFFYGAINRLLPAGI